MTFVSVDEFEEKADDLEERLRLFAMKNVIEGFENKGWALYEAGKKISDQEELKEMVKNNYENNILKPGTRYVPLPHVKGSEGDYEKVMDAVINIKNPPVFVDLDENSIPAEYRDVPTHELLSYGQPRVNGVYPIDSIELNGDLALIIDKRGMPDELPHVQEPAIMIDSYKIPHALKYQVNEYRSLAPSFKEHHC